MTTFKSVPVEPTEEMRGIPLDWRNVKRVVQAVFPAWQPNEDEGAYKLVELIMRAYAVDSKWECYGCKRKFNYWEGYRCWDCGARECGECIKHHFGPQHTPHPKLITTYEAEIAALRAPVPQNELLEAARKARVIVEKWCHYQGNTPELFAEHLAPLDAAIRNAEQGGGG